MQTENTNEESALARQKNSLPNSRTSALTNRWSTIGSFAEAYTPKGRVVERLHAVSLFPERCVLSEDAPVLSALSRDYGRNAAVAWLIRLLSEWQEAMPVQGKMNTFQLHTLSENIVRRYYYLRASEVMLFLARLAGGEYIVKWYGQISPDVIMEALTEKYLPERDAIIYRRDTEEALRSASESSDGITWEEYCRRHGIEKENPLDAAAQLLPTDKE